MSIASEGGALQHREPRPMCGALQRFWRSRRRVIGCFYGGAFSLAAAWMGSYCIWLAEGCRPFMPFVSDFGGGPSRHLFGMGMFTGALLLTPSWFDYHHSTKVTLQPDGTPRFDGPLLPGGRLHRALPVCGVWCSVSTAGVALNPWSVRLLQHMVWATGIFVGAVVFSVVATALGRRRGLPWRKSAVMVAFAVISAIPMCYFVGANIIDDAGMEPNAQLAYVRSSMHVMRYDFAAYCRGEDGSMHEDPRVNMGALFEWCLLGSTCVLMLSKVHAELSTWPGSLAACEQVESDQSHLKSAQGQGSTADTNVVLG